MTAKKQVMANLAGTDCMTLQTNWEALLSVIGQVMAFSYHDNCVDKRKGMYINSMLAETSKNSLIISSDINPRFMLYFLTSAFAVEVKVSKYIMVLCQLKSIYFFDKYGETAHKIYLIDVSHHERWKDLISQFKADNQMSELIVESVPIKSTPMVDIDALSNDWSELNRIQKFGLISIAFAKRPVTESSSIIFGQIATEKLTHNNGWLNTLTFLLNLQFKADKTTQLWLVRKLISDGILSSITICDVQENLTLQHYASKQTEIPELIVWQHLAGTCKKQKDTPLC